MRKIEMPKVLPFTMSCLARGSEVYEGETILVECRVVVEKKKNDDNFAAFIIFGDNHSSCIDVSKTLAECEAEVAKYDCSEFYGAKESATDVIPTGDNKEFVASLELDEKEVSSHAQIG